MEPLSGSILSKAAYSYVLRKIKGILAKLAEKQIGNAKDQLSRALGKTSPDLDGVLQEAVGRAYVATVKDIVNVYLADERRRSLRTPEDLEDEARLDEALGILLAKPLQEIAPTMEATNFLPVQEIDEDRDLLAALMASVQEALGNLPPALEFKFVESLLPTLRNNLWIQLAKSLEREEGKRIVVAFLFQALSQIQETATNAEAYARKTAEGALVELTEQIATWQREAQRADQEFKEEFERATERYRLWVLESNATFFVPGLNVRLPIKNAWDELLIDELPELSADTETLARQISRYHEWEPLAETARRKGNTCRAEDAILAFERLVITGGPGSGKSTLGRRLSAWAARRGSIVIRVSLQRVARLLRTGMSFDYALLQVALDGSGIAEAVGKVILASPDYLIADGLDECDPDRAFVASQLNAWATGHRDCHICVMTRPVGHTTGLLTGFGRAELLPLDEEAIRDLSGNLISSAVSEQARRVALLAEFTRLIIDEKGQRPVASMAARSPLLLTFLVSLFLAGKSLTNKRAELFEQMVDLISSSPLSERPAKVEIEPAIADRVIEATAWHLIATPDIDLKTLRNTIAKDLESQSGMATFQALTTVDQGLRFWEDRGLIERLTFVNSESYTFVYLSFGEYLAARYVAQMDDEKLRAWLLESRREPRWRQPILLASGAGAASRIATLMLQFDKPEDPVALDAAFAASCIAEAEVADPKITEEIVSRLRQRLMSNIPLAAVEAGEALRQLAPLAPEFIDVATVDLCEDEQEWTRLSSFAARMAADRPYVTLEQIRNWLDDIKFVRRFHYTGEPAEKRITDLPEEAYALQEFAFIAALERLFQNLSLENAKLEATKYLKQVRHSIASGMLSPLTGMLRRYEAEEIIDIAFEEAFENLATPLLDSSSRDDSSPDLALVEAIISAAASVDSKSISSSRIRSEAEFTAVSILITALGFMEREFDVLAKRREEESLKEILKVAIYALRLDPTTISSEANSILAKLTESDEVSLVQLVRNIPVSLDWNRVRDCPLDSGKIVQALSHPSRAIVEAAANALLAGIGAAEARPLILKKLEEKGKYSVAATAFVISRLWEPNEAIGILLNRLKGTPSSGFDQIYRVLARLARFADRSRQAEIGRILFTGLYADEAEAAIGATKALSALPLVNSLELQQRLRHALEYWTERVAREDRDAPGRRVGSGEHSYTLKVVQPDPRALLGKLLVRLGAFDTEELLVLCGDQKHGISTEAYEALKTNAASDVELLKSLLTRIKSGLAPLPSSTALNLLGDLLKLPSEILRPVETPLLALGDSEIPAIRKTMISSLNAGWTTNDVALQVAQRALGDAAPGVRNSAARILRQLSSDQ